MGVIPDAAAPAKPPTRIEALRIWVLSWRFLARFAVSFSVVFVLKSLSPSSSPDDSPGSLLGVPKLYQILHSQLARPEAARFTTVLEVDPKEMGSGQYSLNNVCAQRRYVSELLLALAESKNRPTVVVVDKYFGARTCPESEGLKNTAALQDAITKASDAGIDVIVGVRLREDDVADVQKMAKVGGKAIHRNARPIEPVVPLQRAQAGVVNVAANVRQAPLLFIGIAGDGSAAEYESLAWKAVQRYDSQRMNRLREQFNPTDEHAPFVGFLRQEATKAYTFSALAAMCGLAKARAAGLGLDCTGVASFSLERLKNRVVLIGEKSEYDVHESTVGKVYGYFLHVNYIESLLDGRYFFPVPGWVNYVAGFAMFLAVECAFFYLEKRHWGALFAAVPCLCLAFLFVEFILAQALHWLLLPFISFSQFAGQLLERLAERVVAFLHRRPAKQE